jgi:hypothetical protein
MSYIRPSVRRKIGLEYETLLNNTFGYVDKRLMYIVDIRMKYLTKRTVEELISFYVYKDVSFMTCTSCNDPRLISEIIKFIKEHKRIFSGERELARFIYDNKFESSSRTYKYIREFEKEKSKKQRPAAITSYEYSTPPRVRHTEPIDDEIDMHAIQSIINSMESVQAFEPAPIFETAPAREPAPEVLTNCVMCCQDILSDQTITVLECCHIFHANSRECTDGTVRAWISDNGTCPICRTPSSI